MSEPSARRRYDPGPVTMVPVSFWPRAAARVIDMVAASLIAGLAGVLSGIVIAVLAIAGVIGPGVAGSVRGLSVTGFLLATLGSLAYQVISRGSGGATIGKAIMGLRVRSEDGVPATFRGALVRSLAFFVDGFMFGLVAWASMKDSPPSSALATAGGARSSCAATRSRRPRRAPAWRSRSRLAVLPRWPRPRSTRSARLSDQGALLRLLRVDVGRDVRAFHAPVVDESGAR